jgi:hypothetical protein
MRLVIIKNKLFLSFLLLAFFILWSILGFFLKINEFSFGKILMYSGFSIILIIQISIIRYYKIYYNYFTNYQNQNKIYEMNLNIYIFYNILFHLSFLIYFFIIYFLGISIFKINIGNFLFFVTLILFLNDRIKNII